MTIPVALAGVSGILSVSGISRKRCGMAKPLPLGEVARQSRDGEGKDADKKQKSTAIQALFVRGIVSLCFRVLFCRACPLRRWRASSPKGRALGKEGSFSIKPICVCWKTSRNAKASPYQGRWHRAKRRCRRGCTEQHLRYSVPSKGVLCPTSQSRFRSTAVLTGEPLAKRFRFR